MQRRAVFAEQFHLGLRIGQVLRDQRAVNQRDIFQLARVFRDDRLPLLACGPVQINLEDLAIACVQRGVQPETRTIVADGRIRRVRHVNHALHGCARLLQVQEGKLVVRAGALRLHDDQVAAVVGDTAVQEDLIVVRTLEDDLVFVL